MYLLELGNAERNIAKQAIRAGQSIPVRIANAPELILGLQLYLTAFFDLDSERSHGNGLTPIPWSSIKDYAQSLTFDEEQTENLFYFIKELDSVHLKRLKNQIKASQKNG